MEHLQYLIARASPWYPGDYNKSRITFSPNYHTKSQVDDNPSIGVYTGATAHDPGGEMSPKDVMERPGLQDTVHKCGGSWFLPMIHRMAVGEIVGLDEIVVAYRNINGSEMESAPWGKKFPCEEAAINWRAERNEVSIVEQKSQDVADRLLSKWLQAHPETETFKHSDILRFVFRSEEREDLISYRFFELKKPPKIFLPDIPFRWWLGS